MFNDRTAAVNGSGGARTHNFQVKSPLLYQLSYRPIKGLNFQGSKWCVSTTLLEYHFNRCLSSGVCQFQNWNLAFGVSFPHRFTQNTTSRFFWEADNGHLRNCHKQQKRGGNFWFLSPVFVFMVRFLHLTYHTHKQGSTLNMPITAKIGRAHV